MNKKIIFIILALSLIVLSGCYYSEPANIENPKEQLPEKQIVAEYSILHIICKRTI